MSFKSCDIVGNSMDGERYEYSNINKIELTETIIDFNLKYPEYLVPLDLMYYFHDNSPNDSLSHRDIIKFRSKIPDSRATDKLLNKYMIYKDSEFYLEGYNIIASIGTIYDYHSRKNNVFFFMKVKYRIDKQDFPMYDDLDSEMQDYYEEIFEKEILSKLDKILQEKYPDRNIERD